MEKDMIKTTKKNKIKPMTLRETIIIYGLITLFALLVIIPFVVLICSSFSSSVAVRKNGARPWIQDFNLDAYNTVLLYPKEIIESYGASIIITLLGSVLNVFLCATSAFAVSRSSFRHRGLVQFFFTFTIMFTPGFVPNYIWYSEKYLNILDTYAVLIIAPAFMVGHMVLLRAFYSALPNELYEAVKIDGASELTVFWKIATPLIMPGIATAAFNSVLAYWNDAFRAMLYCDNIIPVALYLTRITNFIEFLKFAQESGFTGIDFGNLTIPEDTLLYAIALVTTAPMLCVFVAFQKYFVRGLTVGAVKG